MQNQEVLEAMGKEELIELVRELEQETKALKNSLGDERATLVERSLTYERLNERLIEKIKELEQCLAKWQNKFKQEGKVS